MSHFLGRAAREMLCVAVDLTRILDLNGAITAKTGDMILKEGSGEEYAREQNI
jgi:hypothetical protein